MMTTKMLFELDSKDIQKLSVLFKIYKKETADYNANLNTFVSSLIEYVYICKVLGINENLSFSKYQSLK